MTQEIPKETMSAAKRLARNTGLKVGIWGSGNESNPYLVHTWIAPFPKDLTPDNALVVCEPDCGGEPVICQVTLEQVHDDPPAWIGQVTGRQVKIYAQGKTRGLCETFAARAAERALGGMWEAAASHQLDRGRVPDIPEGQGIVVDCGGDPRIGTLDTLPYDLCKIKRHDECCCPDCDHSASHNGVCHVCFEAACSIEQAMCGQGVVGWEP